MVYMAYIKMALEKLALERFSGTGTNSKLIPDNPDSGSLPLEFGNPGSGNFILPGSSICPNLGKTLEIKIRMEIRPVKSRIFFFEFFLFPIINN